MEGFTVEGLRVEDFTEEGWMTEGFRGEGRCRGAEDRGFWRFEVRV